MMSMNNQSTELVELARSLYQRGYSVGGAGNISCRIGQDRILITPTGSSLGRLKPESLSLVDLDGKKISGYEPSKEVFFHLALYQNNPACNAVVHLHSSYLTALSCIQNLDPKNAIRPFTPYYVMRIGALQIIPYYPPGDKQIAQQLAQRANTGNAFLLANHGVVVTGTSLSDAVNNAEELEETAKLYFILQGQSINYLTENQIQQLQAKGANNVKICR